MSAADLLMPGLRFKFVWGLCCHQTPLGTGAGPDRLGSSSLKLESPLPIGGQVGCSGH